VAKDLPRLTPLPNLCDAGMPSHERPDGN